MTSNEIKVMDMLPKTVLARRFSTTTARSKKWRRRLSKTYELGFYLGGTGYVEIDGRKYQVHKGYVRFTPPGTVLSSIPDYECYTVYFHFGKGETLYKNPVLDAIPEFFYLGRDTEMLFSEIVHHYENTALTSPMHVNALVLTLLAVLYEAAHSELKLSAAVEKCMAYIENNYKESITLDTLGAISGYSKLHLLRLFRKDTGKTPHEILTDCRMRAAKTALVTGDAPISRIASDCGFSSEAHFKVLFKKITGFTPGAYRKNSVFV